MYLPNSLPIGYFDRPNRAICNKFLRIVIELTIDDKITKKKNEEAIQETLCELLKINYSHEDIQMHQKSLNENLHKVLYVLLNIS